MKLKDLQKLEDRKHKARWFSLYGAPLYVPGTTEIAEIGRRITSKEVREESSLSMPSRWFSVMGGVLAWIKNVRRVAADIGYRFELFHELDSPQRPYTVHLLDSSIVYRIF